MSMIIIAYIDPGSGSLLIQSIIAGALAIPFFFRNAIARGISRLRGQRDSDGESAPAGENRTPDEPPSS